MTTSLPPLFSFLLTCLIATSIHADDWPGYRGLDYDGAALHAADLFEGEGPGLALQWRFALGPSYSSLAIADGTVIALGSDGKEDFVVAINTNSGEEVWKTSLGSFTKGHDGSEDGPLSTPAIARGRVFVTGGDGTLAAFDLADGTEVWKVKPQNGEVPFYANSASPIIVGDAVVISRGSSEAGTLVAYSMADGSMQWSAAPGKAEYQTPVLMSLAGQDKVLFWLNEKLVALDTAGNELWSIDAPANNQQAPARVTDSAFLLPGGRSSKLFDVSQSDGKWTVTERWDSRKLKPGMTAPVVYDGAIYGYDRAFLTALDAETGEVLWKSRPPGTGSLVLVGDRLAIFASGEMILAKASPDGYQEEARLRATDQGSLTWPAFADGMLFVRDRKDVAAVRITDEPMQLTQADPPLVEGSEFAKFVARAAASSNPRLHIEHLLRTNSSFPIREGDLVHFLYHGDAEDVGLNAAWLSGELTLERLADTNFFYRTVEMDPKLRLEYGYRIDFDQIELDPLNPEFVPFVFGGERSVLPAVGATPPAFLAPYDGDRPGRLETFTLASEARGDEREISVYIPGVKVPNPALLVVPRGDSWMTPGQLTNTLDHLIDQGTIAPVVVAFVPAAKSRAFTEDDGGDTPAFARLFAEELAPQMRERYNTSTEPGDNVLLANAWHNAVALYTAATYPTTFGGVIGLSRPSPSDWDEKLSPMLADPKVADVKFYVAWNHAEAPPAEALFKLIENAGHKVFGGERTDTMGWGALRIAVAEGLQELLGTKD